MSLLLSLLLIFIVILPQIYSFDGGKNCTVGERTYKSGGFFRHQIHFNVSCEDGKMKVVNCLTQRGTKIPLGTLSFPEDGFNYTCKDTENVGNAPKLTPMNEEKLAEECENGQSQYIREGFVISCDTFALLGCSDAYGDLVREGLFVTKTMALRFCFLYQNRRRARIERRGCFNGTRQDDPNDTKFHFKKGEIWKTPEYDYRCGDEGFEVYKCKLGPKEIVHTGVAWFDKHNVLNICSLEMV